MAAPIVGKDGNILDMDDIKEVFTALLKSGRSRREATDLIAATMGLEITEKGWTIEELLRLKFAKVYSEKNPDRPHPSVAKDA